MKTVNFLGQDWEVPDWAEYITHNYTADGAICVWEKPPVFGNGSWHCNPKDWLDAGNSECVGHKKVMAQSKKI